MSKYANQKDQRLYDLAFNQMKRLLHNEQTDSVDYETLEVNCTILAEDFVFDFEQLNDAQFEALEEIGYDFTDLEDYQIDELLGDGSPIFDASVDASFWYENILKGEL